MKQQSNWITIPKIKTLSRKSKIASLIAGGVLGLSLVAYGIAHYTYGPSSPAGLEKNALSALSDNNIDKLVKYLDPAQSELKKSDILDAFKRSWDDTTRKKYESAFQDASAAAKKDSDEDTAFFDNDSMIKFVRYSNWRGTRWVFQITPAELEYQKDSKLSMKLKIGDLEDQDGKYPALWPSVYKYEAEVSNSYASETLTGSVDLIRSQSKTLDLIRNLQTNLSIRFPEVKNVTYQLNGIPLEASQQNLTISPAPKEATFQVTGTILGKTINESVTVNTKENTVVNLKDALNKGIGKIALDVIYNAAFSWTNAHNTGDPTVMKAANPEGIYYKEAAKQMSSPSDNKSTLVKVAVDPDSVRVEEKGISIDASEQYLNEKSTSFFSDDKNSTASWGYTLQKVPDKEEWWIESHRSSGFWGRNVFNSKNALIKNNPDVPDSSNKP